MQTKCSTGDEELNPYRLSIGIALPCILTSGPCGAGTPARRFKFKDTETQVDVSPVRRV